MYQRIELKQLEDYFCELERREPQGVFVCRLDCRTLEADRFLERYFACAAARGMISFGKIRNPDEKQLAYYDEIMGLNFQMDAAFFESSVRRWLPRLDDQQRRRVVDSLYQTLLEMRKQGKNDNILKNAYIKFMCWFYYKFERMLGQLGKEPLPKILYEGEISSYELEMLAMLARAGCDVLLLEYPGNTAYAKADSGGGKSQKITLPSGQPFPQDFSLKQLQKEAEERRQVSGLYDIGRTKIVSSNTWISGTVFEDVLKPQEKRGQEGYLYNVFARVQGVEDKVTYVNELFHWKKKLQGMERTIFVLKEILPPQTSEIQGVLQRDYQTAGQVIAGLCGQLLCGQGTDLEHQIKRGFAEFLWELSREEPKNLQKLKSRGISLLCLFNRYQKDLFPGRGSDKLGVFVLFGVCRHSLDALFLKLLAGLPLDVLEVNPNTRNHSVLEDSRLFEQVFSASLELEEFPMHPENVSYGTAAYHAEQDLTGTLYQDSGLFRNQQFSSAVTVTLKTMYEEIYLLWDQEAKYRPNFEIMDGQVVLPVMIAKVSGVKDGDVAAYWQDVRKLMTEDTILAPSLPYLSGQERNSSEKAVAFYKNRRLQRDKIKADPSYEYGIFREEIQEYMLDKLEELLESGWIEGTFRRGVEYTIINVVLHIKQDIRRLIQKLDFTKKLPKLVFLCTTESICSQEDAILIAYLHLIGFDILMFVPTGYQVVEKYYTRALLEEYQIGEYLYDLAVPNIRPRPAAGKKEGLWNRIFRRR